MTQSNEWRKKYLTEEQLQKMEALSKASYTEEDRQKLAEWGKNWTEEDQRVASQRWGAVIAELQRLVSAGEDPASPAAQALVQQWLDLRNSFTRGDAGVSKGLNTWYENLNTMPATERPFPLPYSQEEEAFLRKAIAIHKESQGQK